MKSPGLWAKPWLDPHVFIGSHDATAPAACDSGDMGDIGDASRATCAVWECLGEFVW